MWVMPLLQLLGVLSSHVTCDEAAFRKYML